MLSIIRSAYSIIAASMLALATKACCTFRFMQCGQRGLWVFLALLFAGSCGSNAPPTPTQQPAQSECIVLDSLREYSILSQCEVLRDTSGTMSFENILQAAAEGVFARAESFDGSLRVRGREALWLRFTVKNAKLVDWVLVGGNARIDSMTLFTPSVSGAHAPHETGAYISSIAGELTDVRTRAIASKFAVFPLALADDSPTTLYARIVARYTPALPAMLLVPSEDFAADVQLWNTISLVLIGMLLFALVFNIVPLVIVRERVYVWYIIHIVTLIFYALLSATLLAERYITPEWKPVVNSVVQLSTYMVFMQFVRVFFNMRVLLSPVADRAVLVCIVMTALPLLMLIPAGWTIYYTNVRLPVLIASALALLVVLFRAIKVSATLPAQIYGLTMAGFIILKFSAFALGVLQEALLTSAAGVVATMLFSFALASRLAQMREQILQEQQQRVLAEKINEQERLRNMELARANEEISRQNIILEEQAREIELTNAHLNEVILELDAALTDLKETQSQLVHSERIAAVGILTAGVMHEINNPNAAVYAALEQINIKIHDVRRFFVSLLSDTDQQSPEATRFHLMTKEMEQMITVALEGSNRVKNIVASLRSFTKHQEAGIKTASLAEELASTIEMFRYQFKNVSVEQRYEGRTEIEANFGEINQVVLNLLVNAAQAGANRIIVRGSESSWNGAAHDAPGGAHGQEPNGVVVEITDNGCGIQPEIAERMFEPFFTTKGTGNSGLGLSISKKILERHHATIQVQSEKNKGTTFFLHFQRTL